MKITIGVFVLMKTEKRGPNMFILKGETIQEADACRVKWRRINDDVAPQTRSHVRTKFEDSL